MDACHMREFPICSASFFLCLKATWVQRNRLSRGRKWLHLLFSFTPSTLHPECKVSSSKKQLQRTCRTFPTRDPVIWSCLLSKWTKDAGSAWQGSLAWDCLSQRGTVVMKLAPRAVPAHRLFVHQYCLFQDDRVLWSRALKCEAHCTPSSQGALQKPGGGFTFLVWNGRLQKTTPVKMQQPGMPGLLQNCLFLIKGDGMICPDRPDCTTAWHQPEATMCPNGPSCAQGRAVGTAKGSTGVKHQGCSQLCAASNSVLSYQCSPAPQSLLCHLPKEEGSKHSLISFGR